MPYLVSAPTLVEWNGAAFRRMRLRVGFLCSFELFPLNGAGWLAGDVVDHPVDAAHFVDDSV